jgi:hypothetical protein
MISVLAASVTSRFRGLVRQTAPQAAEQNVDDAGEVVPGQGLEQQDLVQPVQKLRAERALQLLITAVRASSEMVPSA